MTAVENGHAESQPSSNNNPVNGEVKAEPSSPVKPVKLTNIKSDPNNDTDSEDDVPLAQRFSKTETTPAKKEPKSEQSTPSKTGSDRKTSTKKKSLKEESDDSDDEPLVHKLKRAKNASDDSEDEYKPEKKKTKKSVKKEDSDDSEDDFKPTKKEKAKKIKETKPKSVKPKKEAKTSQSPSKKKKEEEPKWKWWEEEHKDDGTKWKYLQHSGPMFAPPYEPLPKSVRFKYNGEVVRLSEGAEEVATFYGKMLDHDYTQKENFNRNFWKDWRKTMTSDERALITDLGKCDFREIDAYFKQKSEERKNWTKEQKLELKLQKQKEVEEYGTAIMDGYEQKIANFRIEPPGLFRGRGEHPKMGMLKKRVRPEDVIINCSRDAPVPKPPAGHKWKEVRHDNSVTWLCSWTENVLNQNKYVMLNPSSKIKGMKDMAKYDMARKLHTRVKKIREQYENDFKSKEMRVRQLATAMHFIDKLALRAGNEKDTDEAADTVGCCSLRVEHIKLHKNEEEQKYTVEFDFLGKDSIRYQNSVNIDRRVYKNLNLFCEGKKGGDDLFDRVDTSTLNRHLQEQMDGLTAKVFRTYNASITLQKQLKKESANFTSKTTIHEKILAYNRANRMVAVLCNHQRAIPKTFDQSMQKLEEKKKMIKSEIKAIEAEVKSSRGREKEKAEKKLNQKKDQLKRLKIQMTDKDENKTIALGTSKLNYLDPRISVAWCRKHDIPIEKVYTKTQRDKFQWAIDMTDEAYDFSKIDDKALKRLEGAKKEEEDESQDSQEDDDSQDDD